MQQNPDEEATKKARSYAFRLLAIRPRSRKELRDRLAKKDFPCQVIDSLIDDFTSRGFLNDEKFAKEWIQSRLNNNPKGFYLLKNELRQQGVSQQEAEQAIEEAKEKVDEKTIALEIAKNKKRRFSGLDKEKAKRRVYDFLNRKGFKTSTIYEVIKELYGRGEENFDD